MKTFFAALFCLGVTQSTLAQVNAVPGEITPGSPFMLDINGIFSTPCSLDGTTFESVFDDDVLVVTLMLDNVICPQVLSPLRRVFGAFRVDPESVQAGGSFEVVFRTEQTGNVQTVGQTLVQVVESPPAILLPFSGLYWDPDFPGMGVSLEFHSERVFLASYSYDESGRADWTVAQGELSGAVLEAELLSTSGGPCLLCGSVNLTPFQSMNISVAQLVIEGPSSALLTVGDQPGRGLILQPLSQAMVNSEGTIAGVTFSMPDLSGRWLFSNEFGQPTIVADIELTPSGISDSGIALFANANQSVQFICGLSPDVAYQCQLVFEGDIIVGVADASEVSHNAIRSASLVGVRLD